MIGVDSKHISTHFICCAVSNFIHQIETGQEPRMGMAGDSLSHNSVKACLEMALPNGVLLSLWVLKMSVAMQRPQRRQCHCGAVIMNYQDDGNFYIPQVFRLAISQGW